MKRRILTLAVAALVSLHGISAPAYALTDEEKVGLAAAAILGIAALSHNEHHVRNRGQAKDANYRAMFERGYRDGLHNEPYDSRHSSEAYGSGYDAGHKERSNRLSYKKSNVGGTSVPNAAMHGCVKEVSSSLRVGRHDVHVIKAGQEGSDNFYIELAAGHRHVVCASNSQGQIFDLRDGRL